MTMKSTRVSVVMPTFNRHIYLKEAIESIIHQTMTDFEFIIVNDGSTNDEVLQILAEVEKQDDRVIIINKNNCGPAAARNAGIEASSAPLIALMDDDDVSHPDRLKQQVEYLDGNIESQSVSTAMELIDKKGKFIHNTLQEKASTTRQYVTSFEEALAIVEEYTLNTTTMMRKDAFVKVGRYRAWFKQCEDTDLTLRFMGRYELSFIPDPLYYYRAYSSSSRVSQGGKPWDYYAAAVLSFYLRQNSKPDPVPSATIDDVLRDLSMLPSAARKCLLWRARGALRRAIRDGDQSRFDELWKNCCALTRDDRDRVILSRISKKILLQRVRYFRLWRLRHAPVYNSKSLD